MNQNDMPVFCDVSLEEQVKYKIEWFNNITWLFNLTFYQKIEALREYFKSKSAKLNLSINLSDVVENLNDLIKNLDCLYSSEILEAGNYIQFKQFFCCSWNWPWIF